MKFYRLIVSHLGNALDWLVFQVLSENQSSIRTNDYDGLMNESHPS